MKSRGVIILLLILPLFSFVSAKAYIEPQPVSVNFLQLIYNVLVDIKGILIDMLFEVEEISDQNTTIIVEPAPVEITNENNMAKRGNIILKEASSDSSDVGYKPIYVALPTGVCNITVSSDNSAYTIARARGVNDISDSFSCSFDCSGTLTIDDEYYMVRFFQSGDDYDHLYLAYNCVEN